MADGGVLFVVLALLLFVAVVVIFYITNKHKESNDDGNNNNDDGGGGGGGGGGDSDDSDVPAVYPINNRPKPNGKDPLDDMPDGFVFPENKSMGYHENWTCYKPEPYRIDYTDKNFKIQTKFAIYSFFGVGDDGRLLYSDQWADKVKGQIDGFLQKCTEAKAIAGVSIGGYTYSEDKDDIKQHRFSSTFETETIVKKNLRGSETWDLVIRDPTIQANFINSVKEVTTKHNFVHVDIDYEYPCCPGGACDAEKWNQREGYANFIKNICSALPNLSFSIDISPNYHKLKIGTDLETLNTIDNLTINIMSYDFHVYDPAENASTGHNQPLLPGHSAYQGYNVEDCLKYISKQKGFDGSKYRIGIPMYGRGFPLPDASVLKTAQETGNFSYLQYPKKDVASWVFPASQQQGVIFSSESDLIPGNKTTTYVPGDGLWQTTDNPPGIFALSSERSIMAVRWMAYKYGIHDTIIWTPTQDYHQNNGYNLMKYVSQTTYNPHQEVSILEGDEEITADVSVTEEEAEKSSVPVEEAVPLAVEDTMKKSSNFLRRKKTLRPISFKQM